MFSFTMYIPKTHLTPQTKQPKPNNKTTAEYLCPISGELMRDATIALDGVAYSRAALEAHFSQQQQQQQQKAGATHQVVITSPATGAPLPSAFAVPDYLLRKLIGEWEAGRRRRWGMGMGEAAGEGGVAVENEALAATEAAAATAMAVAAAVVM